MKVNTNHATMIHSDEISGIELVLESIVKTSSAIDRKIVAPICSHWSNAFKAGLDDQASVSVSPFMLSMFGHRSLIIRPDFHSLRLGQIS